VISTSPPDRTAPTAIKAYNEAPCQTARRRALHIATASLQDIIRSRTAAGRAKDLAALRQLRAAFQRQQDAANTNTSRP
jgi:hypothetical protein